MRQRQWIKILKDYDLTMSYHPGKASKVADALSRKRPKKSYFSFPLSPAMSAGDHQVKPGSRPVITFAKRLMAEARKSKFSVYPGSTKMYRDLKNSFLWNGMKRDVAKFVSRCQVCQQVKAEHQRPGELLQPLEILEWK
ncbi:uncharacterized protein LOC142526007 [Primulina tabacum]|uniref:uncharacterized protein LOC142526007 n=1 Tax=Primulina tabacum TaxID=48773 RepID=UPI003F592DC3